MTRRIVAMTTGTIDNQGFGTARLFVAYDDNTLWLRNEEGCWNELDQPPFTAPPEGVADQNEKVARVGKRWHEDGCWQCHCDGVADHNSPTSESCGICNDRRPPRPAGEAAQ